MRAISAILFVTLCVYISARSSLERRDGPTPEEKKCQKSFEELVEEETRENMKKVMLIVNKIQQKIDNGEMPFEDLRALEKELKNQAGFAKGVKGIIAHLYGWEAAEVDAPGSCKLETIAKHKDDCKKMLIQLATCAVDLFRLIAKEIRDDSTSFKEKMQRIEGYEQAIGAEIVKADKLIGECVGDWNDMYCMARKKAEPSKRALINLLSSFVDKIDEN